MTELWWTRRINFSPENSDVVRAHLQEIGFRKIEVDEFEQGEQVELKTEMVQIWNKDEGFETIHVVGSCRRIDGGRRLTDYTGQDDGVPGDKEGEGGDVREGPSLPRQERVQDTLPKPKG